MDTQSTIGAGKSGAQSRKRFGPDAPWFFPAMLLVLVVVSPVGFVVCLTVAAVGQYRRVRATRITLAAVAATLLAGVIGAVADGAGPLTLRWHATSFMAFVENVKIIDGLNWVTGLANEYLVLGLPTLSGPGWSVTEALMAGTPVGVVLGLWLAAAYSAWLAFRRRPLMKFEGEEYEWRRPEGVLDKARRHRNVNRLESGKAASFPSSSYGLTGQVGVGVGEYGALLREDVAAFQRPTLVFGGPRMGKTRFTMSLLAQLATRGSGVVVIDYKGDGELPTFWAEFAHAHGRRFLHFQTADKNGAPYTPPAPTAPKGQAFYDPVLRGNATSRTDMLVNSVDRNGDAKAYFRAAYEVTQVAYAVAEATGYDMQRGSLPALRDLLDLDHLQHVADAKDEHGRPLLADNPDLVARVAQLVATWKKDDVQRGALNDLSRLISTRVLGPAVGAWLRPGPTPEQTIDLVRACLDGDVVVFSLSVQDYGDLARDIGTLALLDLQNAIAVLRRHLDRHRETVGDSDAPPPWAPMYVEIEEFGSAGSDAVLGVLNKAGDVQVRPVLSSQSWSDIVDVDGTGIFADRVLDQAGNIFAFQMTGNTGATALSETTDEKKKIMPRGQTEYSGGWSGMGLKAANLGQIDENPIYERQVKPSAFQKLPKYTMIWLKTAPTRATHSFKPRANRWQERIQTALVPPDATQAMSKPAPGAAHEGPSLGDIDDSPVSPEEAGIGSGEEIPAWGGETVPLPTSTPPVDETLPLPQTAPETDPVPPTQVVSDELPPGWDDDEEESLHEPVAPPPQAAPGPLPQPSTQRSPAKTTLPTRGQRPAPPPPRDTPAWEKQWRSADDPSPTSAAEGPHRTAPTPQEQPAPTDADETATDKMTSKADPPRQSPAPGPAARRDRSNGEVTHSGGTVGTERDTGGLLDLDGFDD